MSFVNFARKEISFKIVFYGPPLCGKTTNLECIHRTIPDDVKGQMTMLSTQQDRTLYFDFLPLRSDVITGFISKFQLYTVPGQPIYNETRRLVLNGVDGLVFVADSQWSEMAANVESFANLEENLNKQNTNLDEIPYILQFNKRDLPNISPSHYLDFLLNQRKTKAQFFEAIATEGVGVFESLNLISRMVIAKFIEENNMPTVDMPSDVSVSTGGE
ncbi:MAG: GTPase domain-containing protein [Kiritimatiellae bacterium]|nr:GTPase domain-containing protein [Kiritimatiellia bacterium]